MNDLTLTLTLPAPQPVAVPDGYLKATVSGLAIADVSGRICGTLTIDGTDLTFEAGEDTADSFITDPTSEWNELSTNPNLEQFLPAGGHDWIYLQYVREVIRAADAGYRRYADILLGQADEFLAAAINGR